MKQTQERNDILPEGRAPRVVRKFLRQVGGLNPYGEDNYRLVLAQCVMILRGGEWWDWPEDTDIEDQGGITFSEEKVWWESHRVKGAPELMILGPFPERGDYEQTAQWGVAGNDGLTIKTAVLQEIPSMERLEEAIASREYQKNNEVLCGTEDWRRVTRLNELRAQQEEETRKRVERKRAYIKDKMSPYWASSLEAGRLREELAKRAGMRSHVGN
jgi:hypothetical protein